MARTLNFSEQGKQSTGTLIMVSVITALITAMLLLGYVVPVYYGVDPAGWGAKLGISTPQTQPETLAVTNKLKPSLQATAPAVNQATTPQADDSLAVRQDTVELVIPSKQSLDYRLAMERDYDLEYHWTANGKTVYTELRGEPGDGKQPGKTFAKLTSATGKGFFIIPFNGHFGWYWQNKSDQPVTIRLHTKGKYQVVGQVSIEIPKQYQ